ncbi:hypothetical protein KUV85_09035 [Nocardioides panacisoli]|uniref:hypothetical protein n=1 Tax=Nocardioides panacisoli TaxID=627624 RepID=UPI001C6384C9|nr:hypothetical protein [Nocardioides panacisoli]QYJ02484.1 hypothetical protein KUV85_09035 [Nocardioides panacisoli]
MASKVVLHLGAMKSGTSFIQNVLGHNKDRLAEAGVLFPGPRWRFQVRAVRELMGYGGPDQEPMPSKGRWRRLVAEIDRWPGIAVVSMEFLGPRPVQKIRQVVEDFDGTPVEAVLTGRDLGRTLPAMWQESVQNGGILSWSDYLGAVRRRGPRGQPFWRQQDLPAIAARWAGVLGEDRFSLVTVPPSGSAPDLLWRRFAEAVGFDPEGHELDVLANPSIGLASTQALLRLNQAYHREHGRMPDHYDPYVKHKLAKRGLVRRSGEEPRLGLDEKWVVRLGEDQIKQLRKAGHRVVGDLADLRPAPVAGVDPDDVSTEDVLDAALFGIAVGLEGWSKEAGQLRRRLRKAKQA